MLATDFVSLEVKSYTAPLLLVTFAFFRESPVLSTILTGFLFFFSSSFLFLSLGEGVTGVLLSEGLGIGVGVTGVVGTDGLDGSFPLSSFLSSSFLASSSFPSLLFLSSSFTFYFSNLIFRDSE